MYEINKIHRKFIDELSREYENYKFDCSEEVIQQYMLSSGFNSNLYDLYNNDLNSVDLAYELSWGFKKFDRSIDKFDFLSAVLSYLSVESSDNNLDNICFDFCSIDSSINFFLYMLKIIISSTDRMESFILENQKIYKSIEDKYILEMIAIYDAINDNNYFNYYIESINYSINLVAFFEEISSKADKKCIVILLSAYFIGKIIDSYIADDEKTPFEYSENWLIKNDLDNYKDYFMNYDLVKSEIGKYTHFTAENYIIIYTLVKLKPVRKKVEIKKLSECVIDEHLDIYNKFYYFEQLNSYVRDNQLNSLEFFDKKHISDAFCILCISTNIRTADVFFEEIRQLNLNSTEKIYLDNNNLLIMINVVNEFSSSLGKTLEIKAYDYLFSLHKNKSIDVLKKAACILGKKIYEYFLRDECQAKDLIHKYISILIDNYDKNIISQFHIFLGKMLKSSFVENNIEYKDMIIDMIFEFIDEQEHKSMIIELLCSVMELNIKNLTSYAIEKIKECYVKGVSEDSYKLQLTVLYYLCMNLKDNKKNADRIKNVFLDEKIQLSVFNSDDIFLQFLKLKIKKDIYCSSKNTKEYDTFIKLNYLSISELFLSNLKTDTFWVSKLASLELLYDLSRFSTEKIFNISVHLSNILKASDSYDVRIKAGNILLNLSKNLENDELNELTVDILKGISVEENFVTDAITHYLGHVLLYLNPRELNECIDECIQTFEEYEAKTAIRILRVFCVLLENYSTYKARFYETELVHVARLKKIIGVFINGILSDKIYVRQQALLMLSDSVFNSENITYEEKYSLYNIFAKKVYNVIDFDDKNKFSIYNNVVSLNNFYRFINDERFSFYNDKNLSSNKVAFFSSSFEELNTSYKSVIEQIIDLGYEIYLNPFSNDISEKNSPYFERRRNLSRAISDDLDVYLFAKNKYINMDNNLDLKKLKSYFPNKEVSLVIGLDRLIKNNAYNKKKNNDSIHSFNHIFYDDLLHHDAEIEKKITSVKNKISGRIVNILLPKVNKCFEKKEYVKEATFRFEFIENFSENLVDEIGKYIFMYTDLFENLGEEISNKRIKFCVMRKNSSDNKILGFSAFHMIDNKDLYREFRNVKIAEYIRSESFGKLMIIDGIYLNSNIKESKYIRELLNETLSYALNLDYAYAIYKNTLLNYDMAEVYDELELFGFKEFDDAHIEDESRLFSVSMKSPICFLCNVEKYIKAEFIDDELIRKLEKFRNNIKKVLTKFYPNNLVLSLDQETLERKMEYRLSEYKRSKSKDYLCVSSSGLFMNKDIRDINLIPFNVERKIDSNIDRIEYGGKFKEPAVNCQLEQIKSYNDPIISLNSVIDDGDEFESLLKLFKNKELKVEKYFTAILSGRGRDLLDYHQLNVDYLYFIPNMKLIFREENLYPFIGGITINDKNTKIVDAIPSINEILPYTAPLRTEDVAIENIFEFSKVCLENGANLFILLQGSFINKYNRRLNYSELGNIFYTPRLPYKGEGVMFDAEKDISTYIKDDKNSLMRLEKLIKR